MKKMVSIIGSGNVGATVAELLARDAVADVVLFDVIEGIPQGKALDILEACPVWGSPVSVKGTNKYEDTADSDIVVITAGFPRKPGMSRDDLLHANAKVVSEVTENIARFSPDAIIIVVTNPMDVMTQLSMKVSKFKPERVIGMGGILDSARFRTFISLELGVSSQDIEALVLGGHGDFMVPLPRFTTVKGISITELLSEDSINRIIERTRHGGAEIVSLLKSGSAYYAPAAATCQMIKAIINDEKRLLPCSAYLTGQYGVNGFYSGVPIILGANGVERIIELELNNEEMSNFERSVQAVKFLVEKLGI
ncbi:MAG: malate dehydrogenase [Thermodesulfovibrionales bacterium]